MAYQINEGCILCGMCVDFCPTGAISGHDAPGTIDGYQYVIDPDACVDCGECAEICPAGIISAPEEENVTQAV